MKNLKNRKGELDPGMVRELVGWTLFILVLLTIIALFIFYPKQILGSLKDLSPMSPVQ